MSSSYRQGEYLRILCPREGRNGFGGNEMTLKHTFVYCLSLYWLVGWYLYLFMHWHIYVYIYMLYLIYSLIYMISCKYILFFILSFKVSRSKPTSSSHIPQDENISITERQESRGPTLENIDKLAPEISNLLSQKIKASSRKTEEQAITVDMWDFAGHELYYTTHQVHNYYNHTELYIHYVRYTLVLS